MSERIPDNSSETSVKDQFRAGKPDESGSENATPPPDTAAATTGLNPMSAQQSSGRPEHGGQTPITLNPTGEDLPSTAGSSDMEPGKSTP